MYAATLAALFIAALVANLRLAGTSPIAWLDTFNDESEVRQCLAGDSCTLTGVSTSIPGQTHAVAWLELRTLLAWLGVGLSGAHLVHLVLNALAATLVFHVATQLGGRLAGAAAVWILLVDLGHAGGLRSLFNTNLLPSLGAVLVLACTAVIDRPGVASVSLAALVAAVLANVHLSCIVSGVSVVWVALLAPRRRLLLAGFGAALFALATVAVAPPSWLHNVTGLLQHEAARGGTIEVVTWQINELILLALFAAAAWLVSLLSRTTMWVEYRRRSQGALAVLVPFLAAFLLAPLFGMHANTKYLAHLKAACAIAAALPLGLVAGTLLRVVSAGRLVGAVEQLVPFVVALIIAVPGVAERSIGAHVAYFKHAAASLAETADSQRTPTVGDLEVVAHILRDEHGWDVRHMLENFTSPYGTNVLAALPLLGAADNAPRRSVADVGTSVALVMLEADELPQPLPSSWKILRRLAHAATVLVVMRSRIDWSRFTVCVRPADGAEQQCTESGWQLDEAAATFGVPHMPPAGVGWRGSLTLRLALRPAIPGSSEEIFMPRMTRVCGGHVASVSGSAAQVHSDRRYVTFSAEPGETAAAALELEWDIGAPECEGGASGAYDGLPPFIIAGDAANVQLLEAILRKREG